MHSTVQIDHKLTDGSLSTSEMHLKQKTELDKYTEPDCYIWNANNGSNLPGEYYADTKGIGPLTEQHGELIRSSMRRITLLFIEVFQYSLFDGKGAPIHATVHYKHNYCNARREAAHIRRRNRTSTKTGAMDDRCQ